MNKDKLIEALEAALAALKQPTITFTPPKREPLSDEILYPIAEARINDEGIAGFYDGFRYAEKYYGIRE